jgi:uncharacterized membrane protein YccC
VNASLQVLANALRIDRTQVHWGAPLRGSLVVGAVAIAMIGMGHPANAIPISIGALFAAVAEMNQPVGHRWRTMLWATMWLMVATLVGGLVSSYLVPVLVVTVIAGLLGGFSSAFGKRPGLVGLLALVVFTIAAGTPAQLGDTVTSTLLIGLGGLIQTVVVVSPHLLRVPKSLLRSSEQSEFRNYRTHLTTHDPILRHAIRLSIALLIGTALSQGLGFDHSYWIPMTIAWMSRPYRSETITRVIARLIGTIGGVLLTIIYFQIFQPTGITIVIPLVIGSLIALALIWADYAIAVAGVTVVVVTLFSLIGDDVLPTDESRILSTCIAAVITIAAIFMWRTPEAQHTS